MAVINPFRGTYYNQNIFGDISKLVAPPYDIVTEAQRNAILKKEPNNIFALELPSKSLCQEEVKDKYECAANILRHWLDKKFLISDGSDAIYPYDIQFESDGKTYVRKGFICLVRADDWEEKTVLPHEKTFKKVTEERYKLRCATRAQFSQIFMIYRHIDNVNVLLENNKQAIFEIKDKGNVIHRLYRIDDKKVLKQLVEHFKRVQLYIADGHHRYTTSIKYRKAMEEQFGKGSYAPYNFTMAYLVDASDPGLIVLPTHRVLTIPEGIDCEEIEKRLCKYFEMKEIECSYNSEAEVCVKAFKDSLGDGCSQGITVMFGKKRHAFLLCPTEKAKQDLLEQVKHKELANLDVVMLEELVFKRALGIDTGNLEIGKDIFFVPDSNEAVRNLQHNQILFFMSPTKVEQVLDVADAGLCMPHKSTYFYPKILTGTILCLERFQRQQEDNLEKI